MAYEVRGGGRAVAVHETQREAVAHVRELIARDPDVGAEIIDTVSGQPAAPAASASEREDLARKVGF